MKNSFIFVTYLVVFFQSFFLFASDAPEDYRQFHSRVPDICDGSLDRGLDPRTNAKMVKLLIENEGWSYEMARSYDLLRRTIDSEQYLLSKILLEKFPALIQEKGLLLKTSDFEEEIDKKFISKTKTLYFKLIVEDYLEKKHDYEKRWSGLSTIPYRGEHPRFDYYWQLKFIEESIYRICLQLGVTTDDFIKKYAPSSLNPRARDFLPMANILELLKSLEQEPHLRTFEPKEEEMKRSQD